MKDKAKEAIKHALAKAQEGEHCVLEFKPTDDGFTNLEVTEHFEQLERQTESFNG
jgi:hypothetical protein